MSTACPSVPSRLVCRGAGCSRILDPHHLRRGMCPRCYLADRKARPSRGFAPGAGPAAAGWKEDAVGYRAAHERIYGYWGAANLYRCAACPKGAQEWALLPGTGEPATAEDGGLWYSTDPRDYVPMCRRCHRLTDRAARLWRNALAEAEADRLPGIPWADLIRAPRVPVSRVLLAHAEVLPVRVSLTAPAVGGDPR